jgi:hypothetical protein
VVQTVYGDAHTEIFFVFTRVARVRVYHHLTLFVGNDGALGLCRYASTWAPSNTLSSALNVVLLQGQPSGGG